MNRSAEEIASRRLPTGRAQRGYMCATGWAVRLWSIVRWRAGAPWGQRTTQHYAETIRWLGDEIYPGAEKIVLLQDNRNTHTPASLNEAFPAAEALRLKERTEWHSTPKHRS